MDLISLFVLYFLETLNLIRWPSKLFCHLKTFHHFNPLSQSARFGCVSLNCNYWTQTKCIKIQQLSKFNNIQENHFHVQACINIYYNKQANVSLSHCCGCDWLNLFCFLLLVSVKWDKDNQQVNFM